MTVAVSVRSGARQHRVEAPHEGVHHRAVTFKLEMELRERPCERVFRCSTAPEVLGCDHGVNVVAGVLVGGAAQDGEFVGGSVVTSQCLGLRSDETQLLCLLALGFEAGTADALVGPGEFVSLRHAAV